MAVIISSYEAKNNWSVIFNSGSRFDKQLKYSFSSIMRCASLGHRVMSEILKVPL